MWIMNDEHVRALVAKATQGDKAALNELVAVLSTLVYRLAVRMLGAGPDAEDATQEVLVKVVTHLATFRGDSKVSTWVTSIAIRHFRRSQATSNRTSLDRLAEVLRSELEPPPQELAPVERQLLEEEVFAGCTQAMLTALDPDARAAFVVGAILDLDHRTAAQILGCSPQTFRKRLSRARQRLSSFLIAHCGWMGAPTCACEGRIRRNVAIGNIDLSGGRWANESESLTQRMNAIGDAKDVAQFYRLAANRPLSPAARLAVHRAVHRAASDD